MRLQAATLRAKGEKRMTGTWGHMTACELGREIGKGRIHPVELTEAFLDAIESHPQASRIYARATPARARGEAMAAAARAKTGLRRGLLDGVPISWKDLFDTAGIATEAGSALLKHRTPTKDAAVLDVATLQGLVCLGKTHMSELAFSGLGLNPVTATPPCLNDDRAVPGGSSSGAAASVAFGLAPAAIGSDTFGSVRIPSAWNDLVGLKTTAGSLPLTGTVPCVSGSTPSAPWPIRSRIAPTCMQHLPARPCRPHWHQPCGNARLAILETVALDDLRDRPAQGFDDAVARLSRAGAKIERIKAPEVTEVLGLAAILSAVEAYGIWRETIEAAPEKMFPRILDRFRSGAQFAATDAVAAWRKLRAIREIWADRVAGVRRRPAADRTDPAARCEPIADG
jgi:aspartyl-tRNA(Asn)/glutamyl-tRNA(Gln) amidotransferase subunit A